MALTRKMLEGMGITSEQISAIIEAHAESIDSLKAQRDEFKASAEKLADVQKELDILKAKGDGGWQTKYEQINADFEAYKADISAQQTTAQKREAYKRLLKDANIADNRIDAILKVTDMNAFDINEDGTFADADNMSTSIKNEWSDFIVSAETKGAEISNPPARQSQSRFSTEEINKMSRDEINANWDTIKNSINN